MLGRPISGERARAEVNILESVQVGGQFQMISGDIVPLREKYSDIYIAFQQLVVFLQITVNLANREPRGWPSRAMVSQTTDLAVKEIMVRPKSAGCTRMRWPE